jgi:hypothetical protein
VTEYRIEHAVVMDTDDIPGRGGYAVVGISDGVDRAERVFVAQNFGISDFLHDPQNQRTFYSFFRVPGGRRALVRRFAKGHRRNQTQNRLFVHTLFIDDALFEALQGVPWLLIQAPVSSAESNQWDVLKDEVPGLVIDAKLPPMIARIDADVIDALPQRLNKRLEMIHRQLGASAVGALLTNIALHGRVTLPQGVAYEQLTMLAWSMLPRPDRDAMAWTQHDAQNITGIAFDLANVPDDARTRLDARVHPIANLIVAMNTTSEDERWQFDALTRKHNHSIRNIERIARWLAWRDALGNVKENIRANDVLAYLKQLAHTAEGETDTWIDGGEVLQILWNNIPAAIDGGEDPLTAVERWAHLLRDSGLHALIFSEPPDQHWLDRAAATSRVGADLLVRFFLFGTDTETAAAPARDAIAQWVLDGNAGTIKPDTLARLAFRLAADISPFAGGILELLLSQSAGMVALRKVAPLQTGFANFVFDAAQIAVQARQPHVPAFLAEVLVPHLDLTPRLAKRITPEFASEVAALLRTKPDAYTRFSVHLQPDVVAMMNKTIAEWLFADPKGTAGLARTILPQVLATAGSASAAPMAFELARVGEPARVWFGVLLERAAAIDTRLDRKAAQDFTDAIARLRTRSLRLEGVLDLLVRLLEKAAASGLRVGDCVRALILLLRPSWNDSPRALIVTVGALVQQTKLVTGWETVVEAIAADFGRVQKLRAPVTALVVAYWLTVDPTQVPKLSEEIVRAITILDESDRHSLAEQWLTRLRRLPESDSTNLLLSLLFPERGGRDLFVAFAQREVDQGIATPSTLKRLDAALARRADYVSEMSNAVVRYIGKHDPVLRIRGYYELLDEPLIPQTLKGIIETQLLSNAFHELKSNRWDEVSESVDPWRLFVRGVPAMSFGYEVGLAGPQSAQRVFDSACRTGRRLDGMHALREGRRRRGALQWALRLIGRDQPLVEQR